MATYTTGLGNISHCLLQQDQQQQNVTQSHRNVWVSPKKGRHVLQEPQLLDTSTLTDPTRTDRKIVIPSNSTSHLSCFLQELQPSRLSTTAKIQTVLVMKVASFSPPGEYLDAWEMFFDDAKKCLSQDYQLLVVDVMQNGGGYVCLGLRLIELLIQVITLTIISSYPTESNTCSIVIFHSTNHHPISRCC